MAIGKWVAAGIGIAALGGAVAFAQYRNIEKPDYEVVISDEQFELREYAPIIVAEVTHTGDRRRASSAGFRRLAAYIFAEDRPEGGERIAMTAPVMQDRVDQNEPIAMTAPVMQDQTRTGVWRTRFVMPSRFTMETLPTPPSDITLTEMPARKVAAVRFSGIARQRDLKEMETRLTEWLGEQELTPTGQFEYAFYDAPMVPGPLRRNEVMVEVETR